MIVIVQSSLSQVQLARYILKPITNCVLCNNFFGNGESNDLNYFPSRETKPLNAYDFAQDNIDYLI